MLTKEFKYFLENQKDLVKQYDGKFIVIKNKKVIGAYDSNGDAYHETIKKEQAGTFLIQHCTSGADAYTQQFFSRVSFA